MAHRTVQYQPLAEPIAPYVPDQQAGPGDPDMGVPSRYSSRYSSRWFYQDFVQPIFTGPEVVFVDRWWQPASIPSWKRHQTGTGAFAIPWEPSLYLEPPYLSWFQPLQVPPSPPRRNPFGWNTKPLEPSLVVEPDLESWHRPTQTPPEKARKNPEGGLYLPLEPGLFIVPGMDSWFMPAQSPLRQRFATWHSLQVSLFDTVAPVTSWLGQQSSQIARKSVITQGEGVEPPSVAFDAVTLSWAILTAMPYFNRKVVQSERYASPIFITPTLVLGWNLIQPDVRTSQRRSVPPSFLVTPFAEIIVPPPGMDTWFKETQVPFWPRRPAIQRGIDPPRVPELLPVPERICIHYSIRIDESTVYEGKADFSLEVSARIDDNGQTGSSGRTDEC
jgi:hypothetical protein